MFKMLLCAAEIFELDYFIDNVRANIFFAFITGCAFSGMATEHASDVERNVGNTA